MKKINKKEGKGVLLLLFLIVIVISIWQLDLNTIYTWRRFPVAEGEKSMTWQWEYAGREYSLDKVLYDSHYGYYRRMPRYYRCRFYGCPDDWEEDYFKMFLRVPSEDNTFSLLATELKRLAVRDNLSLDEQAEFALAFVQAIPYNWSKAEMDTVYPEYPYEILYENQGVCSGKTFLTILLFQELGFATAMFQFSGQEHIAPAIKCLSEYSSYGSGFCFAEATTEGHKIGDIPRMTPDQFTPEAGSENQDFDSGNSEYTRLTEPEIYIVNKGGEYKKIEQTRQQALLLEELEDKLDIAKKDLAILENDLKLQEQKVSDLDNLAKNTYQQYLDSYKQSLYNQYQSHYQEYLRAYQQYQDILRDFNIKVNDLNLLVERYNLLLN